MNTQTPAKKKKSQQSFTSLTACRPYHLVYMWLYGAGSCNGYMIRYFQVGARHQRPGCDYTQMPMSGCQPVDDRRHLPINGKTQVRALSCHWGTYGFSFTTKKEIKCITSHSISRTYSTQDHRHTFNPLIILAVFVFCFFFKSEKILLKIC